MATAFLESVEFLRERVPADDYSLRIPALASLELLPLHPKVTYFIGENGSGKSTLMEAIAVAVGFNPEGGGWNFDFSTCETHSQYWKGIRPRRVGRSLRNCDGFFLRAESYYNVSTEIERLAAAADKGDEFLRENYGGSPHLRSHGESFFKLFMKRFRGNGLYILDEPESALSPKRQLSFLARLHDLIEAGSQFIIATHSPIVMAYPEALIYHFSADGIQPIAYTDTDHYQITKLFLTRHDSMLRELMRPTVPEAEEEPDPE